MAAMTRVGDSWSPSRGGEPTQRVSIGVDLAGIGALAPLNNPQPEDPGRSDEND
jgi:hypothetical protein